MVLLRPLALVGAVALSGAVALPHSGADASPSAAAPLVNATVHAAIVGMHHNDTREHGHKPPGRRLWKGLAGKRGPWRAEQPVVNVDLDGDDHPAHPVGQLLNVEARSHKHHGHKHKGRSHDKVVVVDGHGHRHHGHRHSGVTVVNGRDVDAGDTPEQHGAPGKRHSHSTVVVTGHHGSTVVIDSKHRHTTVVETRGHAVAARGLERKHHHHHHHHDHSDVTVVDKRSTGSAIDGAAGFINVNASNGTASSTIASLVLATTNGTDPANTTFVLNASNSIRTQVYLVPVNGTAPANASAADGAPGSAGSGPIEVNLKLPVFVAATASDEAYCATFDPSPENTSALSVTPCTNATSAHASQLFLYDPSTGVVQPDWAASSAATQSLLQDVGVGDDAAATSFATTTTIVTATMSATESAVTGAMTGSMDAMSTSASASASASSLQPLDAFEYTSYSYSVSSSLAAESASVDGGSMAVSYSASTTAGASSSATDSATAWSATDASSAWSATDTAASAATPAPSASASQSADPFLDNAEMLMTASGPSASASSSAASPSAPSSSAPTSSITAASGPAPSAPPALDTSGPSESTASTPLSASNVTLIFEPASASVAPVSNTTTAEEAAFAQLG